MSSLSRLAELLQMHHGLVNGCLMTDYARIPGLKLLASTTNGTSGIGIYRGVKVYWFKNTTLRVFEVEVTR